MAERYEDELSEPRPDRIGAYEHPALEPEPGYWAGQWAEFKRLAARSWKHHGAREGVILGLLIILIGIVGGPLFGWN
ncbi:hypothetical protein [Dietzia sp. CH92]|uniref:hypothetical protein n=1 Tax=Dietzia sp. CH92 TaxID=3051823 RepID=UPI0028D3A660|nr:hypothetical protein [Dietzia sp. CH92]